MCPLLGSIFHVFYVTPTVIPDRDAASDELEITQRISLPPTCHVISCSVSSNNTVLPNFTIPRTWPVLPPMPLKSFRPLFPISSKALQHPLQAFSELPSTP